MACQACTLPDRLDDLHHAFLWPPQGHTLYKIARYLDEQDAAYDNNVVEGYIQVTVREPNRFIVSLCGLLSDVERTETRILLSGNPQPGLGEFGNVVSLDGMMTRLRGDWLIALLGEKRYASFRQPIVGLEEAGAPIGHEYLFRGFEEDGDLVAPGALFESAKDPRILFNLDRAARLSAVETAARLPDDGLIFINFMPGSVYDPGVCLRTTVNAIVKAEIPPERVVFEIVESERVKDLEHLRGIVNFYRSAGFRIALDDYGSGYNNLTTMMRLAPDFLKFDKSLIRHMKDGAEQRDLVAMLAERCRAGGVQTIGEGVEDADTAVMLRDAGLDYAQGYHFGRPAPVETPDAAAAE